MKTSIKTLIPVALAALILLFSSCAKDIELGDPPALNFKTGGKYTSADATIKSGDILVFGITGSSGDSRDKLAKLIVRISLGGQEYETRKVIEIPEAENTDYDEDLSFKLVTTGTQQIKFILTNTHGLQTEKILTFTVLE